MSLRKLLLAGMLVCFTTAATPTTASADWLFTPFIGGNWGGSATVSDDLGDFEDEFERKMNFGASLAWMGGGIAGFELDFGYSPNFFQDTTGESNFEFGDGNVTTLMANIVLGAPAGGTSGRGIRPYASGGLGIIRHRVNSPDDFFDVNSSNWGFNVGGGVAGFFTDNIGLRGDIRYFRSLQDNEPDDEFDVALSDFRFWRGTVGLVFRFGG